MEIIYLPNETKFSHAKQLRQNANTTRNKTLKDILYVIVKETNNEAQDSLVITKGNSKRKFLSKKMFFHLCSVPNPLHP